MRMTPVVAMLLALALAPFARAADEQAIQNARASLDQARDVQAQILARLAELAAARQRSSSSADLLSALAAIHQMQRGVVRTTRGLVPRTFGRTADALPEQDRQALEQAAVDQRSVRQRLTDWMAVFARFAQGSDLPASIRQLRERAAASPAGDLMEQAVTQIEANRLSQAATLGQEAADHLARLLTALEVAVTDPAALADKQSRELQEILDHQMRIRSQLFSGPAADEDWARLRREQSELAERTRVLAFAETGLPALVLQPLEQAGEAMQRAQTAMREQDQQTSLKEADTAIAALQRGMEALSKASSSMEQSDVPMPPPPRRPPKEGGMPADNVLGSGSGGLDVSPIAQVAADLAMLVKIRRRQTDLHAEVSGQRALGPVPAGRQMSYAALLPQLINRAEVYLPPAAQEMDAARTGMLESAERLRKDDLPGSAARQEIVLKDLLAAETRLRNFYQKLLETLSRIATTAGEAPPMGGKEQEEKAKMDLLMILLREIVRIDQMIEIQEELMASTRAWMESASPQDIDKQRVADAARRQRELSTTGLDVAKQLAPLGGEAGTLLEACVEAAQAMQGAADMLDVPDFKTAVPRQELAMHFLENAWLVVAKATASLSEGQQSSENQQRDRPGQAEDQEGEGSTAGTVSSEAARPWYWNLPPRSRDAISQSLAEPFPPGYEATIKRYYERLSKSGGGQ